MTELRPDQKAYLEASNALARGGSHAMPENVFIYTTHTSTGPSGYFSVVNAAEVVTISAEALAILTQAAQDSAYSWNAPPMVNLAAAIGEALRVLEGAGGDVGL